MHTLDSYRQDTVDRQASYEQSLVDKTRVIRQIEAEQIKSSKKKGKGRDLNSFRKTLELLQAHVHELDQIKMEYHSEVSTDRRTLARGPDRLHYLCFADACRC